MSNPTIEEQNARALSQIMSNMANLGALTMSTSLRDMMASPNFGSTLQQAGKGIVGSKEFQENSKSILTNVLSQLLANQQMRDLMIQIMQSAFSNIIKSPEVIEVLSSVGTSILAGVGELLNNKTTETKKSFISGELGKEIKTFICEVVDETGVPLTELIVQAIQGALCQLNPSIDATFKINLGSE